MWHGGVRVILPDEDGRLLLVRQEHDGIDIWMPPGGAIEEGECSREAAVREVLEETGLAISVERLIWHVEEVSKERGQRFVNFFIGHITGGELALGTDPELGAEQVLRDLAFFTKDDISRLERVYPDSLREEIWTELAYSVHDPYMLRA